MFNHISSMLKEKKGITMFGQYFEIFAIEGMLDCTCRKINRFADVGV